MRMRSYTNKLYLESLKESKGNQNENIYFSVVKNVDKGSLLHKVI